MKNWLSIVVFWVVQASALLVFFVPFAWPLLLLWAASHFIRAIGLTLAFHRYFAHRAFQRRVRGESPQRPMELTLRQHRSCAVGAVSPLGVDDDGEAVEVGVARARGGE